MNNLFTDAELIFADATMKKISQPTIAKLARLLAKVHPLLDAMQGELKPSLVENIKHHIPNGPHAADFRQLLTSAKDQLRDNKKSVFIDAALKLYA